MRRALASLLIVLMTFALVARGVAAPLLHLHPDAPAPAALVSASHHEHDRADCHEVGASEAADSEDSVAAHTHAGHAKDNGPPFKQNKVCDANGACCGPLALTQASAGVFSVSLAPEPLPLRLSAGVKPVSPDRPPSPLLA